MATASEGAEGGLGWAVVNRLQVRIHLERIDEEAYSHPYALHRSAPLINAAYNPDVRGGLSFLEVEHPCCEALEWMEANFDLQLSRHFRAPPREAVPFHVKYKHHTTVVWCDAASHDAVCTLEEKVRSAHQWLRTVVDGMQSAAGDSAPQLGVAQKMIDTCATSVALAQVGGVASAPLKASEAWCVVCGSSPSWEAFSRQIFYDVIIRPALIYARNSRVADCWLQMLRLLLLGLAIAIAHSTRRNLLQRSWYSVVWRIVTVYNWLRTETMCQCAAALVPWVLSGGHPSAALGLVASYVLMCVAPRRCQRAAVLVGHIAMSGMERHFAGEKSIKAMVWETCTLLVQLLVAFVCQQLLTAVEARLKCGEPFGSAPGTSDWLAQLATRCQAGTFYVRQGVNIWHSEVIPQNLLNDAAVFIGSNYGHGSSYLLRLGSEPLHAVNRSLPIIQLLPQASCTQHKMYMSKELCTLAQCKKVTRHTEEEGWPAALPDPSVVLYLRSAAAIQFLIGAPHRYEYVLDGCSARSRPSDVVADICGDAVAPPVAMYVGNAVPQPMHIVIVAFCGGGFYALGACSQRRPVLILGIDTDPIKLQNFEHNLSTVGPTVTQCSEVPSHLDDMLRLLPIWTGDKLFGLHLQMSPPCQPFCYLSPEAAATKVELHKWLGVIAAVGARGGSAVLEESSKAMGPALRIIAETKLALFVYHSRAHLTPVCLPSRRDRMFVTTYPLTPCPAFELLHSPMLRRL